MAIIDPNKAVRAWLLATTAVTNLVGQNVSVGDLPDKFSCFNGDKGVVVFVRGGPSHPEIPLYLPSVQLTCWALKGPDAHAIYRACFAAMHGAQQVNLGTDGTVLMCLEEVPGQPITDPQTTWATVVAMFRLTMRAN